jgi:hypothetical protein
MPLYNFRVDLKGKPSITGQREAESVDALAIELRKMPGYMGSGIQRADRSKLNPPRRAPIETKASRSGLGWIDPMFARL